MKILLIAAVMLAFDGSSAYAQQFTNCVHGAYGLTSCYTSGGGGSYQSPIQSFVNGFIEGRMARLRMERMQMENELLRRQLYGNN